MTKKDFIALADELREAQQQHEKFVPRWVVDALCRFLNQQNPSFMEDRWRTYLDGDCGPNGGTRN